ncbi:hypothetical protein AB4212_16710, partial [Streptomyces sp. 2MCAF27]
MRQRDAVQPRSEFHECQEFAFGNRAGTASGQVQHHVSGLAHLNQDEHRGGLPLTCPGRDRLGGGLTGPVLLAHPAPVDARGRGSAAPVDALDVLPLRQQSTRSERTAVLEVEGGQHVVVGDVQALRCRLRHQRPEGLLPGPVPGVRRIQMEDRAAQHLKILRCLFGQRPGRTSHRPHGGRHLLGRHGRVCG